MISEVVMPQMGADMTEGTVIRWLKHEGDAVTRGEIIAEIETDKANVEIEAFESGLFRRALAAEGDTVKVGEVIAVIAGVGDDISRYASTAQPAAAAGPRSRAQAQIENVVADPPRTGTTTESAARSRSATPPSNGRLRASPVARRIAQERGIDLAQVEGTGPGGRIVRQDVETYAPQSGAGATRAIATSLAEEAVRLAPSKMRQAIARRMSQSKREAPHYYLLVDVDMTDAMVLRAQANEALPDEQRISVNDMIVKATAVALQRHPKFNATIVGEQPTQHAAQHVCIGIALDDGLIAPAILDAGTKTLAEIAEAAKDLVARTKGGNLRAEEMSAGTFTISNLGAYGIEALVAIIQPPQTAILGVGSVGDRPLVRDGQIAIRQVMKVALSADHRVSDGAEGARFLAEIKSLLERPLLLVL